ncbi:MAG: WGR domain-containing protein, partial [Sphingobacteriia bacterium]|nr:WGR domain-containing protein [Sphingobacteriia bacterium]
MHRWVNPKTARYYQADLVEDLFGGWSVVTAWGGLMSHRGQMRTAWVATREQAE